MRLHWVRRLATSPGNALLIVALSCMTILPSAQARSPESPPIVIEVDGEEVVLVLGENVHPQTYDLLSRDMAFAAHPNTKWVFVDHMWVPVARSGYTGQPTGTPRPCRVWTIYPSATSRLAFQRTARGEGRGEMTTYTTMTRAVPPWPMLAAP